MAQANLLTPPSLIPPPTALHLSQKAPLILSSTPTSSLPWPLSLLFTRETPETWTIHENLLLSALRAGDDAAARQILDRMTTRFGATNERMMALKGIYDEAVAKDDAELGRIFDGYEKVLKEDATNFSVRKRRVAVLKRLGRTADAITALTVLVENSPTDVEAWAELSELYAGVGAWGQAIFCMEEVLLVMPNAWSVSIFFFIFILRHPLFFLHFQFRGWIYTDCVPGARPPRHPPPPLRPNVSPRPDPLPPPLRALRRAQRLVPPRLLRAEIRVAEAHPLALRGLGEAPFHRRHRSRTSEAGVCEEARGARDEEVG